VKPFCSVHLFNLVAFLAVLTAIVLLSLAGKATDLAIMTGLVGILGSFKPWGMSAPPEGPAGTPDDPLSVAGAERGKKPVQTKSTQP
jgi:hypothetical protein